MKKRRCMYCGGAFGLTRHYVGFQHLCTRSCKDRFLARREMEMTDFKRWLGYLSRAPTNSAP
jgi:hypothetical protein